MRIAVCDDEEVQRKLIIKYLKEWAGNIDCVEFSNAEEFLFQWEEDKAFDLLILDIEMNGISGMELAARIRMQDEEIPILFITGYEKYMAQGYEVAAIQYLLKPLNKEKLFQVMNRINKGKKQEEKLLFQAEDASLLLKPSDIWYVEADRHYCVLHMAGSRNLAQKQTAACRLRHSLSEVSRMLRKQDSFVQCHRSVLVNLKHISAITRTEIVMDDGTRLPVSRGAYKSVNEAFVRNWGLRQ